jgi:hypothetical protein
MTIERAAQSLDILLNRPEWLVAIGIGKLDSGDPCLRVYTERALRPKETEMFRKGWKGYPVVVRIGPRLRIVLDEKPDERRSA